ncbi:MAG TPA: vanadium-dependent haloperoxidase, partial [Saprospiraceae bacterium]|nr:vanadium-dependent haloperoxidase [Saprospiraceae bacterium]HMQ85543.1 vanadium-dependent haloperoxidase [Saprospiraceae bacterium]
MNTKTYTWGWRCLAAIVLLLLGSCTKDDDVVIAPVDSISDEYATVALSWNELYLEIERFTPGYRPPVSARSLAYIGLTAYESVISAMPNNNSIASNFSGLEIPQPDALETYYWPAVLTAAYSKSMELYFPTAPSEQLFKIYSLQNDYYEDFKQEVSFDVFSRSTAYGRSVAEAVYEWSATDPVGHEAYLNNNDPNYQPPSGIGLWQPTYPDYALALLPHWGEARTFAADDSDLVPDPLPYSEDPASPLYQQALVVRNMVSEIKQGQLAEDRWIADFWSDDCPILTFTPAARWIAVANQVVALENISLDRAVELYARLGLGLNDAGVRCWHEKYRFNIERPIDYIRRIQGDASWNTVMCPDGSGNYFTPNFPAYPSGHATFGAVSAEIMADMFGDNYNMNDRCHEGRSEFNGTPRSFNSFYEMAEENGYSRIPLGVHFQMDSDAGLELGYGIGQKVNAL